MEHTKLISAVIKATLDHTILYYTILYYTILYYTILFSLSPSSYALETLRIYELNVKIDVHAVNLKRALGRQVHNY
jgi:hypothetical protein